MKMKNSYATDEYVQAGITLMKDHCMMTYQMETFSALSAICAGNSPATGEFPTQRPVTRSFGVFCNGWVNNGETGD